MKKTYTCPIQWKIEVGSRKKTHANVRAYVLPNSLCAKNSPSRQHIHTRRRIAPLGKHSFSSFVYPIIFTWQSSREKKTSSLCSFDDWRLTWLVWLVVYSTLSVVFSALNCYMLPGSFYYILLKLSSGGAREEEEEAWYFFQKVLWIMTLCRATSKYCFVPCCVSII